jgi:5'-nucleotidase
MHILVTNDDGVTAPGLLALAQEMRKLVKTLDRPLRVKEVVLADGSSAWASDGAPSDCVALALCGFLEEKVDIVVSGINPYANLGHDVTYSGTVTCAMEAAIWCVPAVAVSLDSPDNQVGVPDYDPAARLAGKIVQSVMRYGLAENTLLNVNVPALPDEQIKGIQITRQGLRVYHDKVDQRLDPRKRPYYWLIGDSPTGIPERGTDFGALAEGYVSVTPIQLDLTAYRLLPDLNAWEWEDKGFAAPSAAEKKAPSVLKD